MDFNISRWPKNSSHTTYHLQPTYFQIKLLVVVGPVHLSVGLATTPLPRTMWADSRKDRVWFRIRLRHDEFGFAIHPTFGFKWKYTVQP